uniref:Uncharacterized protein LOC104222996 n=1 Tax=Nicotiana sylvestris TaxID=4096 RepID=A0A1U7VY02_NICSY|nr:PREDICTED: uncharacterized protein LOC104222996 [Nicotiana sylvestris]
MVRTRSSSDVAAPRVGVTRDRGRGRRGVRVVARAPTRVAVEGLPVVLVGGQVPEAPVVTPRLQETLARFPSMFGVMATQPVVPVQPMVRVAASEEEQLRLARFMKYKPPTFSGLASESAQGFLKECHRILRTMGIVETSGVTFTTFQLKGATYQWWGEYELDSPADTVSLTWVQFSKMFLREFVPQSLRDAWHTDIEQLHQGTISVSDYAVRFSYLARHAPALFSIVRERARSRDRSLDRGHVGLGERISKNRSERADKIRRESTRSRGGLVDRRDQLASHSVSGAHGSQNTHTAQFPQPRQQRCFFECGHTGHMVRDCPKLRANVSQQDIQ